MSKICYINQPAGIGDIFVCQKIGYHYQSLGYEIKWPVVPQYSYISQYLKNFDYNYQSTNLGMYPIFSEDFIYLPISNADIIHHELKIFQSKYKMCEIDYNDWDTYFNFERNQEKENKLFYELLGLNDDSEYCLVSKNQGTPPNYAKHIINYDGNLKIINMDFIDGFTLFDWCKVIENASEIYTIDSSINWIIEKLNLKTDKLFLYSRRHNDFSQIDYLMKKKYQYMI